MKLKCLLAMLLLTFLSCSNTPAVEDKIDSLPHSEPGKTLIVYFSWSGHTQTVANIIHELIGCDMVEIEPEEPYSDEYMDDGWCVEPARNCVLCSLQTEI